MDLLFDAFVWLVLATAIISLPYLFVRRILRR